MYLFKHERNIDGVSPRNGVYSPLITVLDVFNVVFNVSETILKKETISFEEWVKLGVVPNGWWMLGKYFPFTQEQKEKFSKWEIERSEWLDIYRKREKKEKPKREKKKRSAKRKKKKILINAIVEKMEQTVKEKCEENNIKEEIEKPQKFVWELSILKYVLDNMKEKELKEVKEEKLACSSMNYNEFVKNQIKKLKSLEYKMFKVKLDEEFIVDLEEDGGSKISKYLIFVKIFLTGEKTMEKLSELSRYPVSTVAYYVGRLESCGVIAKEMRRVEGRIQKIGFWYLGENWKENLIELKDNMPYKSNFSGENIKNISILEDNKEIIFIVDEKGEEYKLSLYDLLKIINKSKFCKRKGNFLYVY